MSGNSIGNIFKFTSFGESHGRCVGGVVEGCPSDMVLDLEQIKRDLSRRRPKGIFSTSRVETDELHIVSGVFEGRTLGTPIAFFVENTAHNSADYELLKTCFRPSHADYTYQTKYGIRDYRGGGRASARETVSRVVAGSIAKQILTTYGIGIETHTSQIGNVVVDDSCFDFDLAKVSTNEFYCPSEDKAEEMRALLSVVKEKGDSVGGVVSCVIKRCPIGIGEPVFGKLQAELAMAMMSIPSAKGFEYGDGFSAAAMFGSECLDAFNSDFTLATNHSGGMQGGISNGENINFRVAFKPIASLGMPIPLVDEKGRTCLTQIGGRHDVCQVPRAVPIVEAMASIVLVDKILQQRAYKDITK